MEEKLFVLHFFSAAFFNGELLDGWRGADSGNLQAIKACVASPNSFNSPLKKERISRQKKSSPCAAGQITTIGDCPRRAVFLFL